MDIEIAGDSVAADLLGLSGGAAETSSREPSTFKLTPADILSTVGILPDNVSFNVVMAPADPNDDPAHIMPGLGVPGLVSGTVVVYRADTLDNARATDIASLNALIDDINAAFIRGGFRDIEASLDGAGRIVLSSSHDFEIDIAHAFLAAELEVPDPVLAVAPNVVLRVTVYLPEGAVSANVTLWPDGSNEDLGDLLEDINAAFAASAVDEVSARLVGNYLEFNSRYDFTISGTSSNADALGLATVAARSERSCDARGRAGQCLRAGLLQCGDQRPGGGAAAAGPPGDAGQQHGERRALRRSGPEPLRGRRRPQWHGDGAGGRHERHAAGHLCQYRDRGPGGRYQPRAWHAAGFSSYVTVRDERGVIVFIGDESFTLTSGAGDNLDQLGFGTGTYTSTLSTPDYEIEAGSLLPLRAS